MSILDWLFPPNPTYCLIMLLDAQLLITIWCPGPPPLHPHPYCTLLRKSWTPCPLIHSNLQTAQYIQGRTFSNIIRMKNVAHPQKNKGKPRPGRSAPTFPPIYVTRCTNNTVLCSVLRTEYTSTIQEVSTL